MTLTAMLADLYRRRGYGTSPAAEITTRFTSFLNDAHRQVLTTPGLEMLRDDNITFASVATQPRYGLPPIIARLKGLQTRTNMRPLFYMSRDQLRKIDPGLTSSGTPTHWIPISYLAVQVQPSAATGLWAVSDAGGDTTQSVKVETVTTGGYKVSGAIALNGLTRVQLGSLTTHIEVVKFYVSAVGVGNISLFTAASGGTELARIEIGKTYSRYWGIQLWPTPSAIETFYGDYTRVIADMSNGTDEPLLPEDFHQILVWGALRRECEKKDDTRYRQAVEEEKTLMKALRNWVLFPPDYDALPQTIPATGSNLGGWYPAGRW